MKVIFRSIVAIILIIIGSLIVLPLFYDIDSMRQDIEGKLSADLKTQIKINGDITFKILPFPKVRIHNVLMTSVIKGNHLLIHNRQIIIKPKLFDLLLGQKINVKKIEFLRPTISVKTTDYGKQNPLDLLDHEVDNDMAIKNLELISFNNLHDFNIQKGKLIFKTNNYQKIFNNINAQLYDNFDDKINLKVQFWRENIPFEADLTIKNSNDGDKVEFKIDSPIFKAEIDGKVNKFDYKNPLDLNKTLQGNDLRFSTHIINPRVFFSNIINSDNEFGHIRVKSILPVKLNAIIKSNQKKISISAIKIDGQEFAAKGVIEINNQIDNKAINGQLEISKINLDNLINYNYFLPKKHKIANLKLDHLIQNNAKKDINNDGFNIDFKFLGNNIIYLDNVISELKFDAIGTLGDLKIDNIVAKTNKGGHLSGQGEFYVSDQIQLFDGRIDFGGNEIRNLIAPNKITLPNIKKTISQDYNITSRLILLPGMINLREIKGDVDGVSFSGDLMIDKSFNKIPDINIDFHFADNFAIEKYFDFSDLSSSNVVEKTLWLQLIKDNYNFDLSFNNLSFKGYKLGQQDLKFTFGNRLVKFNNINISSKQIDIKGDAEIDMRFSTPRFNANLEIQNFINEDVSDYYFNLPSFTGFGGDINIKISELNIFDLDFKDIVMQSRIEDGNFKLFNTNGQLFGGDFVYNGDLVIKRQKLINGGFTLKSARNIPILSKFNISNIAGISNLSGIISGIGNNLSELKKSLEIELKFHGAAIDISGFGLEDLMKKMFYVRKNKDELANPLEILLSKDNETRLTTANGNASIKNGLLKYNLKTSATGINGTSLGTINYNTNKINAESTFVFLSGTRQKTFPITIAVKSNGAIDNLKHVTNINQAESYINRVLGIK